MSHSDQEIGNRAEEGRSLVQPVAVHDESVAMEVCVVDVHFVALGHHVPPHTAHAALLKPQQANGVCISKPQRSRGRLLNLSSYNIAGTCARDLGCYKMCDGSMMSSVQLGAHVLPTAMTRPGVLQNMKPLMLCFKLLSVKSSALRPAVSFRPRAARVWGSSGL